MLQPPHGALDDVAAAVVRTVEGGLAAGPVAAARAFVESTGRPWLVKPFLLDELGALLEPLLETAHAR